MRRLVFALLLLAAIPAHAAEKWYEAYARGVQAINAKNYSVAAEALQRSISEMPNESNAARARRDTIVYVPHFWLGIAKFNLGDVEGALREWRTAEEQGVVQNTDYYARMREWVARAQAEKQRSAQTAVAEPRKAADAAVSRAMSTQMDALAAGGDRSDTYRAGKQKLSEAVDQFNNAGTDARAYRRAGDIANQARDLFASAAEAAKRARAARPAAQAPRQQPRPAAPPVEATRVQVETQRPAEAPKQVPAPVAEAPKPQPQAARPQQAVEDGALVAARVALQEFRGRLATAGDQRRGDARYQQAVRAAVREATSFDRRLQKNHDAATISATVQFVTAKQQELDVLSVPATAVSSGGGLESAYRAFARGDFDSADTQLTELLGRHPLAEGFLLRGCTRFTRATLSRSPKAGLNAAAEDFRAALKLNRGLRLQKSAFSPKLVTYFESVRASVVR
jgi:hypothetical protein